MYFQKSFSFLFVFLCLATQSFAQIDRGNYPQQWWIEVPADEVRGWEIAPAQAKLGEVILSKRTELGVFSNFADSPFVLDNIKYASIEGLWQGLKYPDLSLETDPRTEIQEWPHTRLEVFAMTGWDAKSAGNKANAILRANSLSIVSYGEFFFNYVDGAQGSAYHLELITRAIREKVLQNPEIKSLLIQTKGLTLSPDHYMSTKYPASFYYHKILMKIRDEEL